MASRVAHLVGRFLGSLRSGGPPSVISSWAESQLLPAEVAAWRSMSGQDRRHAAGVARRVEDTLGERATRPVLAAALLHDVGKAEVGLGTFGRVVATLAAGLVGRERASGWSTGRSAGPRFLGRIGRYLRHPDLGGDLLERAGSDRLTVAWAREHHVPRHRWSVPVAVGDVLKAADDD